ncbi:MAG: hypothetical protein KA807_07575 [Prolixibacteraceae bacterium]|nr:hypothetical protein [Prolixibacteraceae bacterium]
MRNAELHIDELEKFFGNKESFRVEELHSFYMEYNNLVPISTVYWRINSLVKRGVIQRIGRGTYKLGSDNTFQPEMHMKLFKINSFMSSNFPYLKYCIWSIEEINLLAQHLINKRKIYIDVERDVVESVFEQLHDRFKNIFKGQSNDNVVSNEYIIVVRPLVTGSPTQVIRGVTTITIEKLLVDLFCDKEFDFLQGYELTHIFNNAFSKYTINVDKLLRYASRKEKRTVLEEFLKTIN